MAKTPKSSFEIRPKNIFFFFLFFLKGNRIIKRKETKRNVKPPSIGFFYLFFFLYGPKNTLLIGLVVGCSVSNFSEYVSGNPIVSKIPKMNDCYFQNVIFLRTKKQPPYPFKSSTIRGVRV